MLLAVDPPAYIVQYMRRQQLVFLCIARDTMFSQQMVLYFWCLDNNGFQKWRASSVLSISSLLSVSKTNLKRTLNDKRLTVCSRPYAVSHVTGPRARKFSENGSMTVRPLPVTSCLKREKTRSPRPRLCVSIDRFQVPWEALVCSISRYQSIFQAPMIQVMLQKSMSWKPLRRLACRFLQMSATCRCCCCWDMLLSDFLLCTKTWRRRFLLFSTVDDISEKPFCGECKQLVCRTSKCKIFCCSLLCTLWELVSTSALLVVRWRSAHGSAQTQVKSQVWRSPAEKPLTSFYWIFSLQWNNLNGYVGYVPGATGNTLRMNWQLVLEKSFEFGLKKGRACSLPFPKVPH